MAIQGNITLDHYNAIMGNDKIRARLGFSKKDTTLNSIQLYLKNTTYLDLSGLELTSDQLKDTFGWIETVSGNHLNLSTINLSNNKLVDLKCLKNLRTVSGNLLVNNNQLTELSDLSKLTFVGNILDLCNNKLTTLTGLENIHHVGGLLLGGNTIKDISAIDRTANDFIIGVHGVSFENAFDSELQSLGSLLHRSRPPAYKHNLITTYPFLVEQYEKNYGHRSFIKQPSFIDSEYVHIQIAANVRKSRDWVLQQFYNQRVDSEYLHTQIKTQIDTTVDKIDSESMIKSAIKIAKGSNLFDTSLFNIEFDQTKETQKYLNNSEARVVGKAYDNVDDLSSVELKMPKTNIDRLVANIHTLGDSDVIQPLYARFIVPSSSGKTFSIVRCIINNFKYKPSTDDKSKGRATKNANGHLVLVGNMLYGSENRRPKKIQLPDISQWDYSSFIDFYNPVNRRKYIHNTTLAKANIVSGLPQKNEIPIINSEGKWELVSIPENLQMRLDENDKILKGPQYEGFKTLERLAWDTRAHTLNLLEMGTRRFLADSDLLRVGYGNDKTVKDYVHNLSTSLEATKNKGILDQKEMYSYICVMDRVHSAMYERNKIFRIKEVRYAPDPRDASKQACHIKYADIATDTIQTDTYYNFHSGKGQWTDYETDVYWLGADSKVHKGTFSFYWPDGTCMLYDQYNQNISTTRKPKVGDIIYIDSQKLSNRPLETTAQATRLMASWLEEKHNIKTYIVEAVGHAHGQWYVSLKDNEGKTHNIDGDGPDLATVPPGAPGDNIRFSFYGSLYDKNIRWIGRDGKEYEGKVTAMQKGSPAKVYLGNISRMKAPIVNSVFTVQM